MLEKASFVVSGLATRTKAHAWPPFRRKRLALRQLLRALFGQYAIDTVIDVGANRGQFAKFLRYEVGFKGRLVSFEPNPMLYSDLSRISRHDASWQVLPFALARESGSMSFNLMARSELSSLLVPDSRFSDACQDANRVETVITVDARTLDDVLGSELRGIHPESTYLKLDTQGYDLHVLEGASRYLNTARALQTELSFVPLYHGSSDWLSVQAYLSKRDFHLAGVFPVTREENLRMIEADGVFVRVNDADSAVAR